jgi:glycosyltransferase involved in cell wall biosynthesis/thymidylate kinase
MRRPERPLVVAVSGPDGAGKSSLVDRATRELRALGLRPISTYCYGCIVCRRFSTAHRSAHQTSGRPRQRSLRGIRSFAARAHAVVDAAELALRLGRAVVTARIIPGSRRTVIVTDRGPLDGLVKFDPPPTSRIAALFGRLARRYDATFVLDAPVEVLAARDGAHTVDQLGDDRKRFQRWSRRFPSMLLLDATREPAAVLAEALEPILRGGPSAPPASAPGGAARKRNRVVISIFDDLTNPHYHGGGAIVIEKLARCLAEDYETTVVTASRRGGTRKRDGVCYRYLPVGWAGPRAGQLLFHALLPLVARRLPHDLWVESFTPPFSTSFVPLFSRGRVLGMGQQLSGEAMWHRYHLPFWIVERLGLRFYRDIVALNIADGETIRRHNPAASVHVIPNGVDRRPIDDSQLGRGEHILFLGRIDVHVKGLDLLLAAYTKAKPPLPLFLAGAGTPAEERSLAAMLGTNGHGVHWLGHVEGARKEELLERSAFLVMPSRSESFGVTALEGMAHGKPILHFDVPGLAWMHGGGDVCVPRFDVDEFASKMRALANNGQLRRSLGRKAYMASQRYTWEETTARYLSLVRQLLDQPTSEIEGAAACAPAH